MTQAVSKNTKHNPRKKWLLFLLKAALSFGMLFVILRKVLQRENMDDLWDRVSEISPVWFAMAILMQLMAVFFSTARWQRLLIGQGIHAPWKFLLESIVIARFWGAVTPGGFAGFGGWRIYDIAKHTGKVARATATIGVEMILGQLAFGIVVMGASVFGLRFIGMQGVLMVNAFFLVLITAGLVFLSKPHLIRLFSRWLPAGLQLRIQSLIDAACAYQGKTKLLIQATLFGVGTHAFNNLIYVSAAQSLGVDLSIGEVFFGSSLQIFATFVPASINGIGLREAAAVALYTKLGIPASLALLIPIVGFTAEMIVSSCGGLLFLARRGSKRPNIHVDDEDREAVTQAQIVHAPSEARPKILPATWLGLCAGLVGGTGIGLVEALVISLSSNGSTGLQVFIFGALSYGLLCATLGASAGLVLAIIGRIIKRAAFPVPQAASLSVAFWFCSIGFALTAFRIRRDVFDEELAWKSPSGLALLLGCALAFAALFFALKWLIEKALQVPAFQFVKRPWVIPTVWVLKITVFSAIMFAFFSHSSAPEKNALTKPQAEKPQAEKTTETKEQAQQNSQSQQVLKSQPNILFIVVDTLRADHLPAYGYKNNKTPHLDAFGQDAIRFDQAFANASWTRPSFASILSGRYPSSHGVMAKSDSLPDSVITLPEALNSSDQQWISAGFVTNYNVAPYFNFHQGFDEYTYLEPEFVLGADDASAKLLLMQFIRQKIEKYRAEKNQVEPGAAYQDAPVVNEKVTGWIQNHKQNPWFLFVGYMDPHDPYFTHPYNGFGYARAAHQKPKADEADELRKLYDGEIEYWDKHFGQLMKHLKENKLYENTMIVITSDHGEEFNDHGGFWHGTTLYDEQVRVPLLVKLPGSKRGGTTIRHWVSSIDLMPSILKELGLPIPKSTQGGQIFEGTDTVYSEESHEGNVLEAIREKQGTDEYKLITANPGNPRKLPTVELFRVDEDFQEQHNLASAEKEQTQKVMKQLIEASKKAAMGAAEKKQIKLDEDAAERLKNLGYMSDDS